MEERPSEGRRPEVTIVEGVLLSNYYYTIHPSLAMSGNYPFNQRLLSRKEQWKPSKAGAAFM